MMGLAIGAAANLGLAVAGWIAARRLIGGPARTPVALGAVILAWWWATVGVELFGTVGWLTPTALAAWVVLGLSLASLTSWTKRGERTRFAPWVAERWELAAVLSFGMAVWALLRFAIPSLVQPVKVVSDGPIYHLYLAARWWKAGRLFPVATPFGEVGATYFWANGEAWFAWLMTLCGGDRLARVGSVPFVVVATVVAGAIARQVGAGASAAVIAACWVGTLGPLVLFGCEPNVDAPFVAGFGLAVFFFVRFALGERGGSGLALGALAAGLTWGTKPTGVVFVPVLLAVAGLVIVAARGPVRVTLGRLLILAGMPILGMGYWPVRNVLLTGNPLYPLHVELGGMVLLRGWFGPAVMQRSPYFIPRGEWRALVDQVAAVLDVRLVPVWLLAVAGGWAVGRRDPADRNWNRLTWGLAGLAVGLVALYWLVIPYRTQQRFMLVGCLVAVAPLALLFERAKWVRAVTAALLAVHVFTPQPWPLPVGPGGQPTWDLSPLVPNAVPALVMIPTSPAMVQKTLTEPGGVATLVSLAGWALGSFAVAWAWSRVPRAGGSPGRWVGAGGVSLLVAAALVGVVHAGSPPLPFPMFRDYLAGWLELETRVGPRGARVAYAGTNIPYYLLGGSLQNDVQYVNIDAHRDWLMHDYHRASGTLGLPPTWPNPYVGWDRSRPDYDAWRANLLAAGIEILVVARVNPAEGPHNVADADGFPIERGWAEGHPRAFRPLYGVNPPDPRFRFYQVLSGG